MNSTSNLTNMTHGPSDCRSQESWLPTVIMLFVTLILGIIGNILVLLTVNGRCKKRTGNDLFIANVAVSDLALLLVFLPLKLYAFLICSDHKALFPAYCTVIWPMAQVTYFVSIFTMTAMAIHRCRHVVNPFLPPDKNRHIFLCIALIWLISTVIVFPLFVVTKIDPITAECSEEFNVNGRKTYTAMLFVFQLIIPLFIILSAYFLIWRDLSRSTAVRASVNKNGQVTTHSNSRENMQVVRTIATIVFMFALCMLPNHISWMLWDFGGPENRKAAGTAFKFAGILVMFNSCVNPIVYGSLTRHFRRGYFRYLCFVCHTLAGKGNKSRGPSPVLCPSPGQYTSNMLKVVLQPPNTETQSIKPGRQGGQLPDATDIV